MAHEPDDEWREALLQGLGGPVLFVFWALVFWGTLYAALLLVAVVQEGATTVFQRVLSSADHMASYVNLCTAGLAPVVWLIVGIAVWRSRARAVGREKHHGKA